MKVSRRDFAKIIGTAAIGYLTYRVVRRIDQKKARRPEGK